MAKRKSSPTNRAIRRDRAAQGVRSVAKVHDLVGKSPAHRAIAQASLTRLHDLSTRVGESLRHHASLRVRQTASLLVIGTLVLTTAACDESSNDTTNTAEQTAVAAAAAQELTAEVAQDLPPRDGKAYPVKSGTVSRDDRGVYYFEWLNPTSQQYTLAQASKLKLVLAPSSKPEITVAQDGDAVLGMPQDEPIMLVWPKGQEEALVSATEGPAQVTVTPTPGSTWHSSYDTHYPGYYNNGYHSATWFALGAVTGNVLTRALDPSASRAAYRDPPTGSSISSGQPVSGSVASDAPKPFSSRSISSSYVSGMRGGSGSGKAVTGKSASSSSGAATGKSSTSSSGVKSPSSSGFSSGKSSSSSSSSSS